MKKDNVIKTAFDEYTLIKQVGCGGNGQVFSAKNAHGEVVAIKFFGIDKSSNKLKRFKNEIHFCEHYEHKNIVKILDRGYANIDYKEYVFYVMPLYTETLRGKMKSGITSKDALNIFIGLLEGLHFAHKLNTIHRDIKPENIMFNEGSLEPIICDFGIAHFEEDELLTFIETKPEDRLANFQYAAPEQRTKGKEATAQSDIYAAALILNEMFTNEIPQAADYKTIASVAPEYAYLDEVFKQIYKQKPEDRLYPEDEILTEIKVRAEQYQRSQEKQILQNTINDLVNPEQFEIHVASKEYRDGNIVFVMDKDIPQEWFQTLIDGKFNHTSLAGYESGYLKKVKKNELCMPLRGHEEKYTIKSIVTYMLEWIPATNVKYNEYLNKKARMEQKIKEDKRKEAIKNLQRDDEISSMIAML